MGVKGLSSLIKSELVERKISHFKGQKVAIDVSIYLYKFKFNATTDVMLERFLNQTMVFNKHGITPIYIFDGKSNILKQETKDARRENRIVNVTKEDVIELKSMLSENNIEWSIAPTEAEKYCAYINKIGYVSAVFSNDYDTVVFGCSVLVIKKDAKYYEITRESALKKLNLTNEKLIELCIGLGFKNFNPEKSMFVILLNSVVILHRYFLFL